MRTSRLVLALVAALAACGPRAGQAGGPGPVRHNEDIIYAEEIDSARVSDAYEAILTLRPRFLASRGVADVHGGSGVRIVVDGITQQRVDDLRSVRAAEVVYIRYLSATEATTYWGSGMTTPVVYVLTRAGPGAGAVRH